MKYSDLFFNFRNWNFFGNEIWVNLLVYAIKPDGNLIHVDSHLGMNEISRLNFEHFVNGV